MNDKDINLSSVNWTQGMLLTPEHFLRQEKNFDSALLWAIHYALDGYGLVGSGGRVEPVERGTARHDPVIDIDDDGEAIKVSVSQCRGISPSGDIIEISPSNAINRSFPKSQIEGSRELGVYIVCEPHDKIVEDGYDDPANPQVKSTRRLRYRLQLDVTAAEATHSLMISRLRKAEGSMRYERVPGFIPVCTTLIGHSELKRAWERLRDQIISLSERYLQLHKAIVDYIAIAAGSYIPTGADNEVLQFVGRMVITLESSIYDALDPLQPPQRFLKQLYRVVRSASVYLDLSPPTREYFRELAALGLTEFSSMLEQEQQALLTNRTKRHRAGELVVQGVRPITLGNTLVHVGGELSLHTNGTADSSGSTTLTCLGLLFGTSYAVSDHLNVAVHVFPLVFGFGGDDTITKFATAQLGAHLLF